jgi:acetyl/propionyl-CoA carboxylase alpha subunit
MPLVRVRGRVLDVTISGRGELSSLRIGRDSHVASINRVRDGEYSATFDGQTHQVWLATSGDKMFVHAFGQHWELEIAPVEDYGAEGTGGPVDLSLAPMPGVIVGVAVRQGQTVKEGQTLLTMESMKLQTTIAAWRDGVVAEINVEPGDKVDKGSALIRLAEGNTP